LSSRGQYSTADALQRLRELGATQPALCRYRHARRVFRRHYVEIDADAESCRVLRCDAQRVVERPPETALPDFFHQVYAHAQARQPLGLLGLIAAHADEADVARIQHA